MIKNTKQAGDGTEVAECLPSKHKLWNSNISTVTKKMQKTKKFGDHCPHITLLSSWPLLSQGKLC
jgi:hypothetical protein